MGIPEQYTPGNIQGIKNRVAVTFLDNTYLFSAFNLEPK
jgi:hypothetical protein